MAVIFRIWRFIMLGLFCLILSLGCQPDNRLVIKHEPTARHLQEIIMPEIDFRNALMSDIALFFAESVTCDDGGYSITQSVDDVTVSYTIRILTHKGGIDIGKDTHFVKPFAPLINYAQTNVKILKVLEDIARQTKGSVEIDNYLIVIKVPKVEANTNAPQADAFDSKPNQF